MKKFVFCLVTASCFTSVAFAQTTTVETETIATTIPSVPTGDIVVAQDYTFDLERTSDPSLAPLPIDAGDYEIASPGEIQSGTDYTFELE